MALMAANLHRSGKSQPSKDRSLECFEGVKTSAFEEGLKSGKIDYIDSSVLDAFIAEVKVQSVLFAMK
jgi:ribosomal protein S18